MSDCIFILCIISLFLCSMSKKVCVPIIVFWLLITLIIMGTATNIADYSNYNTMYENVANCNYIDIIDPVYCINNGISRNIGYALLNKIFYSFGFSYIEFKFVVTFICLLIMIFILVKYKTNVLLVLFLYSFYPFFMDVIEYRNFIVEIFLLVAIYYYVKKETTLYYLVLILIAGLFHELSLVFLPFVVYKYFCNDSRLKWICYFLLIIGISTPMLSDYVKSNWGFFSIYLTKYDSSLVHFAKYAERVQLNQYIYIYIFSIISFFTSWFIKNNISIHKEKYDDVSIKLSNTNYYLNMYLLSLAPLFPLFTDLGMRGIRDVLIITYILLGYIYNKGGLEKRVIVASYGIAFSLVFGRIDLYMPDLIFNVYQILQNNVMRSLLF